MTEIYISLGTNKGKRLRTIELALQKLENLLSIEQVSSLYLTQPVQVRGGWFINCVIKGQTEKEPVFILQALLQIEKEMGRIREKGNNHSDSRIIDLDLLFWGETIINQENLIVPHPRAHQRRFILLPLAELNPQLIHPLLKKNIQMLLEESQDPSEVLKIE